VDVGVMSRSSVVAISANPLVVESVKESWIREADGWWYVPN